MISLLPILCCLLAAAYLVPTDALSVVPADRPCLGGKNLGIYCGRGSSGRCPGLSHCDIHPTDKYAVCCCNDWGAFCPNCTRPHTCKVNPCDVSSCRAYPDARCVPDYCGGCNARYYVGKTEVTDKCNEIRPCSSRGGRDLGIFCGRGPGRSDCPGSSYCDIHPTDRFATCCCNDKAAICPNCTKPVNCLVDPCRYSTCPTHPRAECRSDYCGGCNARFYVGRREVTEQCKIEPCSRRGGKDLGIYCGLGSSVRCPGSSYCDIHPVDAFATCCCNDKAATCPGCTKPANCPTNPCRYSSCPNFPSAKCRSDYCGGCNARYYLWGIFEVTRYCHYRG